MLLISGEEGAVYVYSGGKTFPFGNVTRNCGVLHAAVEPCPDVTVSSIVFCAMYSEVVLCRGLQNVMHTL